MSFVAFGLSQLPLGLALDRYGPRALTSLFLSMASLGAVAHLGRQRACLVLGRILMGVDPMSANLIAGQDHLDLVAVRLTLTTSLLIVATGIGGMFVLSHIATRGRRLANAFHDSRRGNISSIVLSSTHNLARP